MKEPSNIGSKEWLKWSDWVARKADDLAKQWNVVQVVDEDRMGAPIKPRRNDWDRHEKIEGRQDRFV